jgi:GTP-binding protein Era
MSNNKFKSGFVSIIGRPNVGKSTLLNNFLGMKLAIVSPRAQTTRNRIQGIYTTETEQIIFIDTPGIHKPKNELGNVMNEFAYSALEGTDLILMLVDASSPIGDGDKYIIEQLSKVKIPVILVLNKVDLVEDEVVLMNNLNSYKEAYKFAGGITLSATEGFNIDKLKDMIVDRLEVGPMYYPEDQVLDLPERFVVAEIIREKVLLLTKQTHVPHEVYDEIMEIPPIDELLSPILTVIPLQLIAYYVTVEKGLDVDKPRNLAKSVTVE